MSHYTVIGSYTSPFVRVVRTVCEELNLEYDLENTGFFRTQSEEQSNRVSQANPLMKIPVLLIDGKPLIDSRIIVQYLLKNNALPAGSTFNAGMSIEQENLASVIYGMIDAGILRFIMTGQGAVPDMPYLQRSLERITGGLTYLEASTVLGQSYGFPEIVLVCALDWFKKRGVVDWSAHKKLAAIHAKISEQPALVATRIPENV